MKVDQFKLFQQQFEYLKEDIADKTKASMILLFTSRANLENPDWFGLLQGQYPNCPIISCSTSGEIYEADVFDDSLSAVAIEWEKTPFEIHSINLSEHENSFSTGAHLAQKFKTEDLKHILLFSDGWLVNGAELIQGMYSKLPSETNITGGMAADGANFAQTLVGLDRNISEGNVVAIGLYGENIEVGFGSHEGWNEYGNPLKITRSEGREIFELNGKSALKEYKAYLGKDADGLPGTALLYPLAVTEPESENHVVRTVYNIDELNGSIILGSEVNEKAQAQFMKAKFDNILIGVEKAAIEARQDLSSEPQLALIVSCIGRKLLFDQQIDEEIASTKAHLGNDTSIIGFYSYGEICPIRKALAELHHQALTITTLVEK